MTAAIALLAFIVGGMAGVFAGCLLAGARRSDDCRTRIVERFREADGDEYEWRDGNDD